MAKTKRFLALSFALAGVGAALAGCVAAPAGPYAGYGSYGAYAPYPGYYDYYPPAFVGGFGFYGEPWPRERWHDEVVRRAWEERARERARERVLERRGLAHDAAPAERSGSSHPPRHGLAGKVPPDHR